VYEEYTIDLDTQINPFISLTTSSEYLLILADLVRAKCDSAILRGWVTLRLNFRLKGYCLC